MTEEWAGMTMVELGGTQSSASWCFAWRPLPFPPVPGALSSPSFFDRGREGLRLPALRTGRADLPHPALQLVISSPGPAR
jgi:hypothetical protein